MIIDCHVHCVKPNDVDLLKKTSKAEKFINIRSIDIEELLKPFNFEEFANVENMYYLDSVNLNNDIHEEIEKLNLNQNKFKNIVGIKIYLGYQHYYIDDDKVDFVVNFAKEKNLTVTFHCGEILNDDNESEYSVYSDVSNFDKLAKKFPDVNFVISHINWPNCDAIFKICNKFQNVYTCFSGCNDGETVEEKMQQNTIIKNILINGLKKYPNLVNKLMYGTDFFSFRDEYADVSSYLDLVDLLNLNNEDKEKILYLNTIKAYKL